jgi:hypothetical protein
MKNKNDIASAIIKSADSLKTRRATTDTTFQEISDYILLNKGDFIRTTNPGDRRDRRVFDSTAVQANEQLASILHGGLTDPTTRWFNLRFDDELISNIHSFKLWLEQVHKIMMKVFTRSESGFQQQNHETFLNLTGYGTGAMWVIDEKDKGISFSSRHLAEIYIEENSKGFVDTVYREFNFTARQAAQEWGVENLGTKIQTSLKKEPHKEFKFVHCVMPKEDYEREHGEADLNNPNFKYVSIYVSTEDKKIVEFSGFHEMPFLIPRWEKLVGETYGRSPSWNALSDILMVNIMSEVTIKASQKQVDPPLLMADDGVIAPLQTFPGGINIGGVNDEGRQLIQPLITGIRLDIGLDMMEQRRQSIRSAYFVDQFMDKRGIQPRTATEVNDEREKRLRLIGPQIRRIEDEYLSPLIDRVFNILKRKGAFPPLPKEVLNLGIKEVDLDIEYVSPLAFTQRSGQLLAYNRFFANAGTFVELNPSTLENFDTDFIVRDAAELSGIPAKAMIPAGEVEAGRQAQAQAQQQQELMGTIAGGAEVAANLSKAGIPLGE